MEVREYRTRKALIVPHLACSLLAISLMGISWSQGEPPVRLFIPTAFALLFTALAVNALLRRLRIDAEGITQYRLFGAKALLFAHIAHFDVTHLRKRAFFALSTDDDRYILFSNAYGNLGELLRTLCQRLPAEAVEEEISRLADHPPVHQGSIITLWLMAGMLAVGILLQSGLH